MTDVDDLPEPRCVEELLDLIREAQEARARLPMPVGGRWLLVGYSVLPQWWDGRPIVDVVHSL